MVDSHKIVVAIRRTENQRRTAAVDVCKSDVWSTRFTRAPRRPTQWRSQERPDGQWRFCTPRFWLSTPSLECI